MKKARYRLLILERGERHELRRFPSKREAREALAQARAAGYRRLQIVDAETGEVVKKR